MTPNRLALLVAGLAAAGTFALPTSASADPPCFSQEISDCLEPVQQACYALLGNVCNVA